MTRKSVKGPVALGVVKGILTLGILLFFAVFSECGASAEVAKPSEIMSEEYTFEELNPDEVTTEWNDLYLFSSREDASEELEVLKNR